MSDMEHDFSLLLSLSLLNAQASKARSDLSGPGQIATIAAAEA
jgi:hypothetical protein